MTAPAAERARLIELLYGFFPAQVLQTLARLGVPDLLGDGPLPLDELAVRTATQPGPLFRLLRSAAALGLVEPALGDCYALTSGGDLLLSGAPGSVGNLAQLFCGDVVWRSWGELEWSVRTGSPAQEKLTGRSAFDHMSSDPAMAAIFTEAMAEGARAAAPGVVASCDLTGVGTLADVGGGNGTLIAAFLTATPGLRGLLFDTAEGLGDAASTLDGVADRCEVVAGDFFAAVPPADAHVCKSVIHDWDDDRSLAILANIRAAMPAHGALYLVEPVVAADLAGLARQKFTLMSDLNMLVCTGGKERTEAEFSALLEKAGLRLTDVTAVPPPTGYSILRAVPA